VIRPPAFSGSFYPADPGALRREIDDLLARGRAPERETGPSRQEAEDGGRAPEEAAALLAPHAGYVYSGGVAGKTYALARLPSRLVLLGPNHTGRGAPFALYDAGEWQTPLGRVAVDAELARRLLEACPLLEADAEAHRREHALEVQLPFLQVRVPNLRFVPVCVGSPRLADLQGLGEALARVLDGLGEPCALVISSDMTHYESREAAERLDRKAIAALERVDAEGLHRLATREDLTMCGVFPAVAALTALAARGVRRGRLVGYATSGDVTGDFSSVVAYAGLHFR
jgi:hypothetical protein